MWYFVIILLLLSYVFTNYTVTNNGILESYFLQPLLWTVMGIITLFIAYHDNITVYNSKRNRTSKLGRSWINTGILLGGFHVTLLLVVGFFFGFGKSPYPTEPVMLLINSFLLCSFLFFTEISRAYLIKKVSLYYKQFISTKIVIIAIFYSFLYFSFYKFSVLSVQNPENTLLFIGGTFVPIFCIHLLANILSLRGNAIASIPYVGIILGFERFAPILPNAHWTIIALASTIAPTIGYFLIADSKRKKLNQKLWKKLSIKGSVSWTIFALFAVFIILLSNGYFGIKPTVIYSESMSPEFAPGDLVFIENIEKTSIAEGDIIQYIGADKLSIIHRVIEVKNQGSGQCYVTKGDANTEIDPDPVMDDKVLGKAVFKIPFVGWIPIYLTVFINRLIRMF